MTGETPGADVRPPGQRADDGSVPAASPHSADRHSPDVLADRAAAALTAGQLDAAIDGYGELLRLAPDRADLWHRMGIARSRKHGMNVAAGDMATLARGAGRGAGYQVAARMAAQAGQVGVALELARAAVAAGGEDAGSILLLCRLHRTAGQPAASADLARSALGRGIGGDKLRLVLAGALLDAGDAAGALDAVAPVVSAAPGHETARTLEGDALQRLGDTRREEAALRAWMAADPDGDRGSLRLVNLLVNDNRAGEAWPVIDRLLKARPADGRFQTLGAMVLVALDKERRARPLAERGAALLPESAEAQVALATVLNRLGDYAAAEAPARRATELAPGLVTAHNLLTIALRRQNRLDEAEAASARAVRLAPDDPDVLANLATLHWTRERHAQSVPAFDRALALRPDDAEMHYNRALAHLAVGDLDRAWADFAWRWKQRKFKPRPFPQPWWDGSRPAGRILAWGEQGIGDEVLAAGMLGDLAGRAPAGIVLECDRRFVPLIRRSFPDIVAVPRSDPAAPETAAPDIVAQVPVGDLHLHLRRRRGDFRPHSGYLRADPAQTAQLRRRYKAAGGGAGGPLLVGISWQSTNPRLGVGKSLGLAEWTPILQAPGVTFVSLQYGDVAREAAAAADATGARILVDPEIDSLVDIDGFAAQVAAMDLVVTVSNTAVHFAGALNRPAWLMLPRGNGLLWYWLMCQGEACPWYPSIRVFRQDREGDWSGMVERLARTLRERAGQ